MGCDIEWGGESEVAAPAAAAGTVLGASAFNDDDDDSSDERGGEGGIMARTPPRRAPFPQNRIPAFIEEFNKAKCMYLCMARAAQVPQAPHVARTAQPGPSPPPLSSTAEAAPPPGPPPPQLTAEEVPLFWHIPSLHTTHPRVWDDLQYAWRATFDTEVSDTVLETWLTTVPHAFSLIKLNG